MATDPAYRDASVRVANTTMSAVKDAVDSFVDGALNLFSSDNSETENKSETNDQTESSPADPGNNENDSNKEKHEGFKNQVKEYKDRGLNKAAKNLNKQINKHQTNLKNDPNSNAANHWKKEIQNFKEQLKVVKDEIANRGIE